MKEKSKKIISIAIVLFMVLNYFVPVINRAEENEEINALNAKSGTEVCKITATANPELATVNSEINAIISVSDIKEKIGAISMTLNYDSSEFEMITEINTLNGWTGELVDNLLILYTPNFEGTTISSQIASIKFKVKENCTEGKKTISFNNIDISKDNMEEVSINNTNEIFVTVDKTAPVISVKYSSNVLTNKDVTATITSNEELQGISGWTLSNDKKILTKVYKQNTTEEITVKDLAGNATKQTIKIANIDKQKPTLKIGYSPKDLTNKDVIVTITANKELQVISGWTLSKDKKTLTKVYKQNATEEITVKDLAGNEVKQAIKVANIVQATGDVTKDGVVNIGDLLKLKQHMAYEQNETTRAKHPNWKLDEEKVLIGDVNKNGKIDVGDILKLQRYIAATKSKEIAERHSDWLNL